jgi:formate dehydrogenase subunit delta
MENRDIVRMTNQIAAYFEAYPRAEALDGIAKHIKLFWDPRMRKQLDAYLAEGGEGLSPLVISAMTGKDGAGKKSASKGKSPEQSDSKKAKAKA